MKHSLSIRVGPAGFRIGSAWAEPIRQLRTLYEGYPEPTIPDFTVCLEPARPWRRHVAPSVAIRGDHELADAAPLALRHALLAAEMGMNLQLALGDRGHLLLHAAALEKGGRAIILTGESGAGKSTLAALLMAQGWRLFGDEFALVEPATGLLHPFPRPVSLKNESVAAIGPLLPKACWGPLLEGTPKGTIRHLAASRDAVARMDEPAPPALLLFPRHGHALAERPIGRAELFVRLTQASPNYVALGEAGFHALTRLVTAVPARAIDYPDGTSGVAAVERLWAEQ